MSPYLPSSRVLLLARILVIGLLATLASLPANASAATPDAAFAGMPDLALNGAVDAALQVGDRLFLGGNFSRTGAAHIGQVPRFAPSTGAVSGPSLPQPTNSGFGSPHATPDGNGGYYIATVGDDGAGGFEGSIKHVLANGTEDAGFVSGLAPTNVPIKLYHAGAAGAGTLYVQAMVFPMSIDFTALDGTTGAALPALTPPPFSSPGQIDAMFDDGTYLYIGGSFSATATIDNLVRVPLNGNTYDPAFDLDVDDRVTAITGDGSDHLYVAGSFSSINGNDSGGLAAVDTVNVTTFWEGGFDPDGYIDTMYADNNSGRLFVGGRFDSIGAPLQTRHNLATVSTSDGSAGNPLPEPDNDVLSLAPGAARTLYMGGYFTNIGAVARHKLAALDMDTDALTAFDPDGGLDVNKGESVVMPTASGVIAVGDQTWWGGTRRSGVLAFDTSTNALDSFAAPVSGTVAALASSGNRLFVGGHFDRVGANGVVRSNLASFSLSSGAVQGFAPNPDDRVESLVTTNGELVAGGRFEEVEGISSKHIAAWTIDDMSPVDGLPGFNSAIFSLAADSGYIYAGGVFDSVGGVARDSLARISATTHQLDATWDPHPTDGVNAQVDDVVLGDSTLYVIGWFDHMNNGAVVADQLAAVSTAGTGQASVVEPTISGGRIGDISGAGDRLYACGSFTNLAGSPTPHARLASYTLPASIITEWRPTLAQDCWRAFALGPDSVLSVELDSDGHSVLQLFAAPPTIGSQAANGISATGATVAAPVTANGSRASVTLQYGPTAAYGSSQAVSSVPASGIGAAVSTTLAGLTPGTTYHARLVATSAWGAVNGPDLTFTTSTAPAVADTSKPVVQVKVGSVVQVTKAAPTVSMTLTCAATETSCTYTLAASSTVKKKWALGSLTVVVPGATSKVVKFKLSKAGLKLLASKKVLKVVLGVTVKDAAGNAGTGSRRFTIKLKGK